MPVKTPKFYYQKKNLLSFALLPFGLMFLMISFARNSLIKFFRQKKLEGKFVICVGNLTLGGAGKTPSAIFIAEILQEMGLEICFLSKGYGRKSKGFQIVSKNSEIANAAETGDEPQILKKIAPVYLFSKYSEISQNISKIKEKIIIMDDGLQNPSIYKNFIFLIIDGIAKFGNGFPFPAGPLRELSHQSDIILQIEGKNDKAIILTKEYELVNAGKAENFIAFAGLAINEKFFASARKIGLNLIKTVEFEDHHAYTENEILNLLELAKELKCKLITTEKDFVKIPNTLAPEIAVLKLTLVTSVENKEKIKQKINI